MKTISRDELYAQLLHFIRTQSKAYKEGICTKYDAERFANELTAFLAKKNYYIKKES